MSVFNTILKMVGMYISPEDENTVKQKLAEFWAAAKYDQSKYITYKERETIKAPLYGPIKVIKSISVPKNHDCYGEVQKAIDYAANIDNKIDASNETFINQEIKIADQILRNIDGKSLDTQQRKVVVSDEDRTLVLAGAGSGKTLTIAGKVKYLCDVKNINPSDILLISFTKKSAEELTERINNKLGIDINAVTFHKLGLDIISRVNNAKPEIIDNLAGFVGNYFKKRLQNYPDRIADVINFFAYYLTIPVDFSKYDTLGDAFAAQKTAEFESLKSRYNQQKWTNQQLQDGMAQRTTLKRERMKSMEEVMLANFLFLNGVEYEYEKKYPYQETSPDYGVYHPDFYLPQYDIYIEHFGITEDQRVPWLDGNAEHKYLDGIVWKRNTHKRHNTKLLETYSYMVTKGTFTDELTKMLKENGVQFKKPSFEDIFKVCYMSKNDQQLREFIGLCCSFITLFKSKGYGVRDLDRLFSTKVAGILSMPWLFEQYINRRETLFKRIIEPILAEYEQYLTDNDAIDYSDMINMATALVPKDSGVDNYKYIIIDEYQDISKARYNLVKAIIDKTQAKLLCVGDDWQSIYRFAGSDVSLFTDFEKYFGKSLILKIEQTYRNSQQLINVAEDFVMQNPRQLKKKLSSAKFLEDPIKFVYYYDSPTEELKLIMDALIKEGAGKSIMLLGRTKNDKQIIDATNLFTNLSDNKLRYKASPNTPIQFNTVHKSKGLEADNVIILNFKNALLGFPNKIADDPILEKVLDVPDEFMYAEERRLLYVALTRTRNYVYLLVENDKPSEFLREFKDKQDAKFYRRSFKKEDTRYCPKCKTGILVVRRNPKDGHNFMGCSNYPQCDYTYHKVEKSKGVICPKCGAAMVRRKGKYGEFYGCSNYPTCRYTKNIEH